MELIDNALNLLFSHHLPDVFELVCFVGLGLCFFY